MTETKILTLSAKYPQPRRKFFPNCYLVFKRILISESTMKYSEGGAVYG